MGGVLARALSLSAALLLCAATAAAAPPASCPERHDVEQEIDRLGAGSALALKGTTDVSVDGGGMRIVLRGRDGKVLGAREVAAPEACQERAVVAAVVIAAWLGEWSASEPRAAGPPETSPTPVLVAVPAAAPRARRAPRRIDLAGFGSVVHDGDVGTWDAGGEIALGLGDRFSVTAQAQGTGERTQALGPGRAAYRSLGFGVGASWRHPFGRAILDAGLGPEALRTALRGEDLATARSATAWTVAVDGRIRLGLRLAAVVPFVYTDVAYGLVTSRLTLDDTRDQVTLSRWNVGAGLGVLFSLSRPKE